jgi:hypothetical protein
VILAYPLFYTGRIYPGVSVQNVELDGLTVEEATAFLTNSLPTPTTQAVTLQGDERSWQLEWADVGREFDWAQTAEAAYQAGRRGPWYKQALSAWRIRRRGLAVEPRVNLADASRVKTQVEAIASQVYVPPTDAALQVNPSRVTCVSGTTGRALDVEATSEDVMTALVNDVSEVDITTVDLPPRIHEPEPGCRQARSLLAQPFKLVANDPLTSYQAHFEVPPERLAAWLRPVIAGDQVLLQVHETMIEPWLLEIAPQLGAERILDVEETLERTSAALQAGEHQARSAIQHPETSYVVQTGDTLFDIAYSHGFPQWRLEEANPDVEPGQLLIGMELTIPSIDVLFPEPLVPGKRIEIDLPEQRLRAYEHEDLVYEFTCSSGMTSTPTIAGQFQVLFKEPEAYAQRWSLEMPYFMAIYYEGPDFANGIHELPIRSGSQRLWASVLGWPASYGCIILDVGAAEKLYHWAPVGTLVRIEGVAPGTPAYVPTYDEQTPEG